MKRITIAIDGHSSCGKSTMAKDLAAEVGYIYVDTGAMYRTVTLFAIINGMFDNEGGIMADKLCASLDKMEFEFRLNAEGRPEAWLNGENVEKRIRSMEVSSKVSQVAAIPGVRGKMVALQQEMGKNKGVVMDGRDIGTTVFPDAELKIFVTASAEVRAQRRYDELKAKGVELGVYFEHNLMKECIIPPQPKTHNIEVALNEFPDEDPVGQAVARDMGIDLYA